jgi:hypothetical protein
MIQAKPSGAGTMTSQIFADVLVTFDYFTTISNTYFLGTATCEDYFGNIDLCETATCPDGTLCRFNPQTGECGGCGDERKETHLLHLIDSCCSKNMFCIQRKPRWLPECSLSR